MKKITLASIALVSLLFIGCGEKPADANATTEVNTTEPTIIEENVTEPAVMEENTTVEENITVAPESNTTEANTTEENASN